MLYLIRASVVERFFGSLAGFGNAKLNTDVEIRTVPRDNYESACRAIKCGEVISTVASTSDLAIADFIHVVAVKVQGLTIGKLHLKFYEKERKVKRTFVAFESQLQKLLHMRRDRIALAMQSWTGDKSQAFINDLVDRTMDEIESMVSAKPTVARAKPQRVSAVAAKVASKSGAEPKAVTKEAVDMALAALEGSIDRKAVGVKTVGVVTEFRRVPRNGANGPYEIFCLKLDVDGTHIPMYGVELERECIERKVKAGDRVEVVDMGKQQLEGGYKKNLFRINVLERK